MHNINSLLSFNRPMILDQLPHDFLEMLLPQTKWMTKIAMIWADLMIA